MTPQSSFMIVAPILPGQEAELGALLASMNEAPGLADPDNPVFPFGRFGTLHVARFVILRDLAPEDALAYGMAPSDWPPSLAFLGDCDGPAEAFLAEAVRRAEPGLRQIFAFCRDFPPGGDLLGWMKRHGCPAAAVYVNWIGRSLRQVREEAALRDLLVEHVRRNAASLERKPPAERRAALIDFVEGERRAGRLRLSPPEPTPFGWWLGNLLHAIGVPLLLLLLAPFLILYLPIFAVLLRRRETTDKAITPRPERAHVQALAAIEDRDVTNQFSALGMVKPGLFRLSTVAFLLWLLDYASRHIFNRGHLTRVQTIHFARWVFLDGKKRLFFASNYDGSLESYMDDFINKVGWGLNLVFSNGIGYPTTNWLINDGSKDEQPFKYYLRRHETPTDVWYKAYPGLTTCDLARNARIRDGLERPTMSDGDVLDWLALL
jgi:hypothetical protein